MLEIALSLPTTPLFHLPIYTGTKRDLLDFIFQKILVKEQKIPVLLATPNPEQIVQAHQDAEFSQNLNQADIFIPDGTGVVWASKVLAMFGKGKALGNKISGVELVEVLLKELGERRAMLIGGRNYEKLKYLVKEEQNLRWVEGYQDIAHPTEKEEEDITQALLDYQPELVFVALGAPWQEKWMVEHRDLLGNMRVKFAMAVGGSFDELLGNVPRTPNWMDRVGLKWLHRLIIQPWRWKRQLRLPVFAWLTLREVLHPVTKNK
jgi:N-acetylglucosaminyldiphosphoundecaprenol N-acetyl-beta-D-mannosaminyltransferase